MEKRKSLQTDAPIQIEIIADGNRKMRFNGNNWTNFLPFIEVYDNYYAESNIYIVSLGNYEYPSSFYDIMPQGYGLIREIKKLIRKRSNLSTGIRNTNREIKMASDPGEINKLEAIRIKQKNRKKTILR